MRHLWVGLLLLPVLGLSGCSNMCKSAERAPNQVQAAEAGHGAHQPSEAFKANELIPRQHSFIFPDPKGHFGYHVSQFEANHQHQFIVRGKLVPTGNKKADAARVKAAEKKIAGKARNGYFSVTSDQPRFLLNELIGGERKEFLANIYDGLIITRPPRVVEPEAKYLIEEKLFESPMYADEPHIPNSVYIVFGSYGSAKKTHYLAHLIKGANNFEQILVADFSEDVLIPNGALMALGISDDQPLKAGTTHDGQIDGRPVKFTVKREVYFDKRTAAGF